MNVQQQQQPKSKQKKKNKQKNNQPNPQRGAVRRATQAPLAKGFRNVNRAPQIISKGKDVRVVHREMVGRVNNAITFTPQTFDINPGLVSLFPWLSRVAAQYESYNFRKLTFRYQPACGAITSGTVAMAVDYDPSDPAPYDLQQLLSYESSSQGTVWNELSHQSRSVDLNKRKSYFTRMGPLPGSADINTYDVGKFTIATELAIDANAVGYLWVEYDVELTTPQTTITNSGMSLSACWSGASLAAAAIAKKGTAPLTMTTVAGSFTLTASAPYTGIFAVEITGTGLVVGAVTPFNGATSTTPNGAANAAATTIVESLNLDFPQGGFVQISFASATITAIEIKVGQYNNLFNP